MRWHLVVVGFLVSILACSSSGGSGNGPGTGSRDGGTTADGSSTAELDGAADPDGSMVDRPTDEPVVECVDEATRTSALASDAYCAGCGCATCDAGAGVRPGEMTLKDAPSDFCPPEASAEVMTGFLQQARKKLVASSPLTRVLDIRDVAATKFREISAKAAASTLTDADIVSALATFRSAESELVTLRTDFEEKCNRFKIDAWWTGDVTFTRWYGGKELGSDCIWDAVTGREACPKDRVKYARALEVRVARAVGFYEEMYAFGHLEDVPLTTQLLGVRETELLGTNYGTMRRKLADARSADADVKAQALKADPEVAPQVGDITQVLKEKPSFEEVKYSVDTYRDFATREIDLALGRMRRRIASLPLLTRTDGLPDIGEARPASVFLTLNELLRRYYDSDEWKRAVLLFSETADQLYGEVEKETLMDEDVAVLVKNDDEAEALIEALRRHLLATLETPAMIDCRDIASASKDPVPCYVDSAVIQLVASQNQEEFDRQAPKYLGAINEIYLKKGERLISRKTYDAELASYKDSVIAQYTRALTQLSDLDLCKVRNDAYTETIAAREQSRIGAFIYDTCDLALQDSFDKRIDAAAKTEIATRIGGLSSDIRARTTFRGIRENWVGDDKMAEVLQAAFRGASAAVSTYVQSYTKGIKRTSAVVKTVANVATVVAATLLVPATGGASAVAMSVLTVGTAAGTVEVVLTKLDDVDASAVRAFARGFASGAIPTLFQAGTTALVAQLARTRLLSGATMGGLSYLENVTVGALSAGSLHVVESAIAGKPIDLTDLLTHTLTGGFLGGAIFSAHTVAKLGWAARIRTKNQKLLDPMAFEGVATKLGYMGLAGRKDPTGNVDWSGVYDDLAPLLATQQGRATTLAKLANDPQAKSLLGRLVDGYGPIFVPPTVPVASTTALAARRKILDRMDDMVHATEHVRSESIVRQSASALDDVCDYAGRVFKSDPVFWTEGQVSAGAGFYVSRPVLSKFLSEHTAEAIEIQRLMRRAKEVFADADKNAFFGNIFPRMVDGKLKRGAIGDMLDDKVLCDLGITLNPKVRGYTPIEQPVVIKFEGEIPAVVSDRDVTELMKTFRAQLKEVNGQAPAGGVYVTPDGGRKGFIVTPMIGGVRTKSGTLVDINDPRLFPLAKRYYRMVKEEMMHTVQFRPKDGMALFSDDLRSWYRRRFDRGSEAEKIENMARFREELKYLEEVDIVTYQSQGTMDPTLSTDELIRSYPQRLAFMKKVLNDPFERGRDFNRDWSHILHKQNVTAGEVRTRGQ